MANLFGTGINQAPLNSMLGNLAFQDKAFVSVDKIGIGTTAVDTGTSGQVVQAYGGAYVSGNLGVGVTNPQGAVDIRTSPQWSSFNYAANLVIGGTRNNGLGILDFSNSNPWAIANNAGNLVFAQMPALGNIAIPATEAARITTNRNLLIGSITETGTASQRLQVSGGAYVSGSLGVGVTNPLIRIDAYSSTQGSTAIRATSSPSFSSTLYPGVIAGLSTNAASSNASQFAAAGLGLTSGEIGVYSFWPTFANFPADTGPRRAVDLVGGFATGVWGTEYFAINVGRNGASNDSGVLNNERLRVTGTGNVGIATTNPLGILQVGAGTSTFIVTGIGSVGIGITNPAFKTDIAGDARITSTNKMRFGGTAGTTNFYIQYNSTANSLDFVAG